MDLNSCTQYNNYGIGKIHVTGLKHRAYDWTLQGVKYANGQSYVGDGTSDQPPPDAAAIATPGCRSCHGGC